MKKYDIVIVSHEKDFNNIKFIVEYAEKNLTFDSIHLILSERKEYGDLELIKTLTNKPIYQHKETDILKVDKERIKYRPNWIYQMFLKMFQDVTENDNFLVIESDCIILNKIDLFKDDKTIFHLCRDQNHEPYFNFSKKIMGLGREYNHSFIAEFIMYDKKIIKDMIEKSGCNSINDFLELIYKYTDNNCYPADYELYGNFCFKYYPDKIIMKKSNFNFFGRDSKQAPFWSDSEINNLINTNKDKDVISFHTWGEN